MPDNKQMAMLALQCLKGDAADRVEAAYAMVNVCEWLKRMASDTPPAEEVDPAKAEQQKKQAADMAELIRTRGA